MLPSGSVVLLYGVKCSTRRASRPFSLYDGLTSSSFLVVVGWQQSGVAFGILNNLFIFAAKATEQ